MNEEHTSPMTPLDQMLAQDSLQMLKAAVPYFPAGAQRIFALYAKMMELSHTISMFSGRTGRADDDVRATPVFTASGHSAAASNVCRRQPERNDRSDLVCFSRTGDFADAAGTRRTTLIRR